MSGFERTHHAEDAAEYRRNVLDEAPTAATLSPPAAANQTGGMSAVVARQQGFTGDACHICGSMRMQIAGHCTVCSDCGSTTGCS